MSSVASKRESLAKTFTYFLADSTLTGVIALVVTRRASEAVSIAMGVQVTEIALYYFHERVWEKFRRRSPERARTPQNDERPPTRDR